MLHRTAVFAHFEGKLECRLHCIYTAQTTALSKMKRKTKVGFPKSSVHFI